MGWFKTGGVGKSESRQNKNKTTYSPCGRQCYITEDCGNLKRFSFSFSGIDFLEDVFVTSPDD